MIWACGAVFLLGLLAYLSTRASSAAQPSATRRSPATSARRRPSTLVFDALEVVGEAYNQGCLAEIAGPKRQVGKSMLCQAKLIPEPENEFDPYAVRVEIRDLLVGYLSKESARFYRDALRRDGVMLQPYGVAAVIEGGWKIDEEQGIYTVRLVPHQALKAIKYL